MREKGGTWMVGKKRKEKKNRKKMWYVDGGKKKRGNGTEGERGKN